MKKKIYIYIYISLRQKVKHFQKFRDELFNSFVKKNFLKFDEKQYFRREKKNRTNHTVARLRC